MSKGVINGARAWTSPPPTPVSSFGRIDLVLRRTVINGLAVYGKYIYWTSGNRKGKIGRNIDGSGVNLRFITGARSPDPLAIGPFIP